VQAIKDSHVLVADSSDCKTIMLIRIVLHGTHKLFLVQLIIQKSGQRHCTTCTYLPWI